MLVLGRNYINLSMVFICRGFMEIAAGMKALKMGVYRFSAYWKPLLRS